jgi:hypothetical protein
LVGVGRKKIRNRAVLEPEREAALAMRGRE